MRQLYIRELRTAPAIETDPGGQRFDRAVWNKSFRADTIPFLMVINHGQKPKYNVEDSHPAIIFIRNSSTMLRLMMQYFQW